MSTPPIPKEIIVCLPQKMLTTTATDAAKKKAGGRKAGTGNYTREELTHLLDILERRLPIGPEEWEACVLDHTAVYPGRDEASIRRKYNSLHRKTIPTGDPTMPPEVRQAKRIKYKLADKAHIGDGEEDYDLESATFFSNLQAKFREDLTELENQRKMAAAQDYVLTQPSQSQTQPSQSQPSQTQEGGGDVLLQSENVDITTSDVATYVPMSSNTDTGTSTSSSATSTSLSGSHGSRALQHNHFMEFMKAKHLQEMENRREDRKLMMEAIGCFATAFAKSFGSGASGTVETSENVSENVNKRPRITRERSSSQDSEC